MLQSPVLQIYPLRTYTEVPANAYIKDIDNELVPYEGLWKGTWNGKAISVNFKRVKNYYTHLENRPYYNDVLIGKFKVQDSNGNSLLIIQIYLMKMLKLKEVVFFSSKHQIYINLY